MIQNLTELQKKPFTRRKVTNNDLVKTLKIFKLLDEMVFIWGIRTNTQQMINDGLVRKDSATK